MAEKIKYEEFYTETDLKKGILREVVEDKNGEKQILTYDLKTNKITTEPELNIDGVKFRPAPRIPWLLPSEVRTEDMFLFDFDRLYEEIKTYLEENIELPQRYLYNYLPLWIMYTWIFDTFKTATYLFFLGKHQTGKTRLMEVLNQVVYHGYTSSSPTESSLARDIDELKVVPFLDEITMVDLYKKNLYNLLASGYKKGCFLVRVSENSRKRERFDVFGPKVLAGRNSIDAPLTDRCLTINMKKNNKIFNIFINEESASRLRTSLLLFRFIYLKNDGMTELTGCIPPLNKEIVEKYGFNGRLGEVLAPTLIYPLKLRHLRHSVRKNYEDIVNQLYVTLKNETSGEKKCDVEYEMTQALSNIVKNMVFDAEKKFVFVTNTELKGEVNKDILAEKEKYTTRQIVNLACRLGFRRFREENARGFKINLKRLNELCDEYDIPTIGSMVEEDDMDLKPLKDQIQDFILDFCQEKRSFFEILVTVQEKYKIDDTTFDEVFNRLKTEGMIFPTDPEHYLRTKI